MNDNNIEIEKKLGWCLFFCRVAVFIVFAVWVYDKFARPEHGVEMMSTYYWISGVPEIMVTLFGVLELVLIVMLVLGLYKRVARGFFLFLSALAISVPEVLEGYFTAIFHEAHPTILFFTGFCVFACCFAIYYLRDYDTKFSLSR
jgi:hypothetical protein